MDCVSPAPPRTVHVEHCMGTAFSIDIRDPGSWDAALAELVSWLHYVDATFSTYRPESPISRLDRDEIGLHECPSIVREVLDACEALTSETGGSFSARPSGRLDPAGYVKGWAIERASGILRARGSSNHAVNGGGDVQFAGERASGEPWRIGIAHPLRPGQLVAVVNVRDGAVATSGTAERGAHVVDPLTGHPAVELASVTVVGRHLTRVDAFATAGLAMGRPCLSWLEKQADLEGLVVGTDGRWTQTTGFADWT